MSPLHTRYKRDGLVSLFKFQLSVPFDFNVNVTFAPVPRKDKCPFLLCLKANIRWHYIQSCTVIKDSFIPWSVILPNKASKYLEFSISLLFGQIDNCSDSLLKVLYQPTNVNVHPHAISFWYNTATYARKLSTWNYVKRCYFSMESLQLESYRDLTTLFSEHMQRPFQGSGEEMHAIRVTVPVHQKITIKIDLSEKAKDTCNTSRLHLYNGPGVLSHKMEPETRNNVSSYPASTFQVFVVGVTFHHTLEQCSLQYEGYNTSLDIVELQQTFSMHWNANDVSKTLYCSSLKQTTACVIQIEGKQGIIINITNLRGSRHISYSEYNFDNYLEMSRMRTMYKDSVGLCYYGLFAVGSWSLYHQGEKRYHLTPLCTAYIEKTQAVWLSSQGTMNVFLYSYEPYSTMETRFLISASRCESVTIQLCSENNELYNMVHQSHSGEIKISYLEKLSTSKNENVGIMKVFVAGDDSCLALNILKIHSKSYTFCSNYRFDFASKTRKALTLNGFVSSYHFYYGKQYDGQLWLQYEPKYISMETHSGTTSFESKGFHSIFTAGEPAFLTLNIAYPFVQLMTVISAIAVETMASSTESNPPPLLHVSAENVTKILGWISQRKPKCFKLMLSTKGNISKSEFPPMTITTTSVFSRDVFLRVVSDRDVLYSIQNDVCLVRPITERRSSSSFFSCDKNREAPGRIINTKIYSRMSRDFVEYDLNVAYLSVVKTIRKTTFSSSLYVDSSRMISGVTSRFELRTNRQVPKKEESTEKMVDSLLLVTDVKPSQSHEFTVEDQAAGVCYNEPVNTDFLSGQVNNTDVLIASTSYLWQTYKLYYRVKGMIHEILSCYDFVTCQTLLPHEPDLVSWKYADNHCRANSMALLTIGTKEEELHIGSLQTSVSKDGNRYDMQLIYLGLFTKVEASVLSNTEQKQLL